MIFGGIFVHLIIKCLHDCFIIAVLLSFVKADHQLKLVIIGDV